MNVQIGEYDMTDVILDLGSEVNVLPKQTWGQMGKPSLDWSPIQLRLANQQKIVPLGRLLSVPIDLDGVSTLADFEVIEIIDDSNPYPALLGIEWAMANAAIINLKRRQMTFEGNGLRVIIPLDPSQGERYTEPLRDEGEQDTLDHIYNITAKDADYVEPDADGVMDWQCDSSCMSDSDDGLENWQNRLYELHGHRCARITKSLRCLSSQTRTLTASDGSTDPQESIVPVPT